MNDPLEQIRLAGLANKKNDEERTEGQYSKDSADRLIKIIETKVRTSFIGALAQFEELIGKELWGFGKPNDKCDEDELYWRKLYQQVRTNVLNNGNAQLRALQSEIIHYSIEWNRYQLGGRLDADNQE